MSFRPFFWLSEENSRKKNLSKIHQFFFLASFFIVEAQNDIEINNNFWNSTNERRSSIFWTFLRIDFFFDNLLSVFQKFSKLSLKSMDEEHFGDERSEGSYEARSEDSRSFKSYYSSDTNSEYDSASGYSDHGKSSRR